MSSVIMAIDAGTKVVSWYVYFVGKSKYPATTTHLAEVTDKLYNSDVSYTPHRRLESNSHTISIDTGRSCDRNYKFPQL